MTVFDCFILLLLIICDNINLTDKKDSGLTLRDLYLF